MGARSEARIHEAIEKFKQAKGSDLLQVQIGLCTAYCLLGYYGFLKMSDAIDQATSYL